MVILLTQGARRLLSGKFHNGKPVAKRTKHAVSCSWASEQRKF
jgi:hypothetical protein